MKHRLFAEGFYFILMVFGEGSFYYLVCLLLAGSAVKTRQKGWEEAQMFPLLLAGPGPKPRAAGLNLSPKLLEHFPNPETVPLPTSFSIKPLRAGVGLPV